MQTPKGAITLRCFRIQNEPTRTPHHHTMTTPLPDIQKTPDTRRVAIREVGVSHIRFPLILPMRDGTKMHTVAQIAMTVDLPAGTKGTHMSRFLQILNANGTEFDPRALPAILTHMRSVMDASYAYMDMRFPIFLKRSAPVTGSTGIMDYDCHLRAVVGSDGEFKRLVGVVAKAASLCPCSKEISEYGAHNQRSNIGIYIQPCEERDIIWFEDLIELAEKAASCALFPVLKREDEKFVTMAAYDNPKFVEDIVRDTALALRQLRESRRVNWFRCSSVNEESIHSHNAAALVEEGELNGIRESWLA